MIAPLSTGERSLAEENLKALQALDSFNSGDKELVVFDRGYHSHQFINSVSDKQITYVMRVKNGFFRKPDIGQLAGCPTPMLPNEHPFPHHCQQLKRKRILNALFSAV